MQYVSIVRDFSARLNQCSIQHLVGGSLASSAWGEARHTNDADFLLAIDPAQAESLIAALGTDYLVEPDQIRTLAHISDDFSSFQVLFVPTSFKIDCFVATSAWDDSQLSRAVPTEIEPGAPVPFASAEDTIIAKCRWYELGGRVSDRQWNDLVKVYEIQKGRLDVAYIERWLGEFDHLDLWQAIQDQASP